ncbi:MAG TPA: hypothetical protein VF742_06000, partial [Terracidiphilus sp.]
MMNRTYRALRRAALLAKHEAGSLKDDFQLLAGPRGAHCAFRQSHVDNMTMLVRADEDVGRAIYFRREFEPQESAFVSQN